MPPWCLRWPFLVREGDGRGNSWFVDYTVCCFCLTLLLFCVRNSTFWREQLDILPRGCLVWREALLCPSTTSWLVEASVAARPSPSDLTNLPSKPQMPTKSRKPKHRGDFDFEVDQQHPFAPRIWNTILSIK